MCLHFQKQNADTISKQKKIIIKNMALSDSSLHLLNSIEFSAIPGVSPSKELAANYRRILVKSYVVYFQKIAASLKIDLNPLIQKIDALDVEKHFSPALFVYYDILRQGYSAKNLHQIFDALQSFKNLKESALLINELKYSTILTEPWEFFCLNDMRRTPLDELGQPISKPVQMLSLVHWEETHFPPTALKEAIDMIQHLDPALSEEFYSYVASFKLFAGKFLESTTSTSFFGAIYIRLPFPEENPVLIYLRNVIHEFSHLHLYAMMAEDPIVLNAESERFTSPLRVDKRPMVGIFHAAFVLSRMVRSFRKYLRLFPENEEAQSILKINEKSFLDGLETIQQHARLTENGQRIFKSMEACAFE